MFFIFIYIFFPRIIIDYRFSWFQSDFHVAGFMACILLFISNACFASQPECLGKWCGTLQKKQFECITVNTNRKQTQDSMTRHENIMNRKHKPKKQMKNGLVWQHENIIKSWKHQNKLTKHGTGWRHEIVNAKNKIQVKKNMKKTVKNMKTEIHMKKNLCPTLGLRTGSS